MGLRRFHAENHQNSNQNTAQNTSRHQGFCYSLPKSNVFAVLTALRVHQNYKRPPGRLLAESSPTSWTIGGTPPRKEDQPSRPSFSPPSLRPNPRNMPAYRLTSSVEVFDCRTNNVRLSAPRLQTKRVG